jgi:hypothetical protein
MDHVIFDCEIKREVKDVPGGWDNPGAMGVSVAVVYEYLTDRYRIYGDTQDELKRLQDRLCIADRIGGFNIRRFDIPLVFEATEGRDFRHPEIDGKIDDMLERIWRAKGYDPDRYSQETHGGWGLDNIASATLGANKIGYGGDAPKWYKNGEWYRVVNYCCDDVALERQLSEFVERYGYCLSAKKGRVDVPPYDTRRYSVCGMG